MISDKELDVLIAKVYSGEVDINSLPVNLYNAVSKHLIGALEKIEGTISKSLARELSENLQYFAGSKTYHFIKDLKIIKNKDEIKTFSEFKAEALAVNEQYNVNWLSSEYATTIGQAQMCERWEQIMEQKEKLPFLQYSAVIDDNTSEICLPLDGITLPVDDEFWDSNSPENHYNCRCSIIQLDEFDAEVTPKEEVESAEAKINEERQPLFSGNPYKDKEIFNSSHPYFDLDKDGARAVDDLVNGE